MSVLGTVNGTRVLVGPVPLPPSFPYVTSCHFHITDRPGGSSAGLIFVRLFGESVRIGAIKIENMVSFEWA